MLRIGLTGGIGSGKSTAAERFRALGATVVDADVIAHELVEPGSPALDEIVSAFGDSILDPEGRLDRDRLRARVFADAGERQRLEAILHPRVREALERRAREAAGPYVVLVIPLLVESGYGDVVDRVLVVDAPDALRLERVTARGIPRAEARAIMAAQASRAERLAVADDVIVNDGDLDALERQVDALDERYHALGA